MQWRMPKRTACVVYGRRVFSQWCRFEITLQHSEWNTNVLNIDIEFFWYEHINRHWQHWTMLTLKRNVQKLQWYGYIKYRYQNHEIMCILYSLSSWMNVVFAFRRKTRNSVQEKHSNCTKPKRKVNRKK